MYWLRNNAYRILVVLLTTGIGVFVLFTGSFSHYVVYGSDSEQVLEEYHSELRENPYDARTMLEAARYHYRTVKKRKQKSRSDQTVEPLIKEGLEYYRRLISNPNWELSRKDYFYSAYFYYQLGPRYYERSRALALRAYDNGFRSRGLITLLANIHYHLAESEDDYEVALKYYDSLRTDVKDPVVLYNKSMTYKALGEIEKAKEILKKGENFIDVFQNQETLSTKYRLAKVQLNLERGRYREALQYIRTIPEKERSLELRTLLARCLIELNRTKQAKAELQDVVKKKGSPREAELLLRDITRESSQNRS